MLQPPQPTHALWWWWRRWCLRAQVAERLDAQLRQVAEASAQRKSALEGVLREHMAETQGMVRSVRSQLAEGASSESRAATVLSRSSMGAGRSGKDGATVEQGGALVPASRPGTTHQFSDVAIANHNVAKDMDTVRSPAVGSPCLPGSHPASGLGAIRSAARGRAGRTACAASFAGARGPQCDPAPRCSPLPTHRARAFTTPTPALWAGALERHVTLQRKGPRGGAPGGTAGPEGAALDRTLHRLLDRNVQLALQLQQLGTDLQRVYRRFKVRRTPPAARWVAAD